MTKRVLVIAAHPDDEVLGAGGTIAKHVLAGDVVHVLILAEGITARDAVRSRSARELDLTSLTGMAHEAHRILGSTNLVLGNFPDNRMDSVDLLDIIKSIEIELQQIQPDIVYTHHAGDVNIDHRIVHQAVVAACRPVELNKNLKTLLFFEIASSSEWQTAYSFSPFIPQWFVDISPVLDKKMAALMAYGSEMRPFPHSRSLLGLEYLARWRGVSAGISAAEAFVVGRNIC